MIRFEASAMAEAVGAIKGAVARSSPIPVLTCCLLSADAGKLQMVGTNLDIWASTALPAEGMMEPMAVPLWLLEAVAALDGRDVALTVKGTQMVADSGRANYVADILPATDFPLSTATVEPAGEIQADELARGLAYASVFAERSESTLWAQGVCLEAERGLVRFTGFDRKRLGSITVKSALNTRPIIIPLGACSELARMSGAVSISVGETMLVARSGEAEIATKLIEATMPDHWKTQMPGNCEKDARFDVDEAIAALRRLAKIAASMPKSKRGHVAHISAKDDGLTFSIPYVATETIAATVEADIPESGILVEQFLSALTALSALGVETASFNQVSPSSPQRIISRDDVTLALSPLSIMPVSVKEAA